MEKAWWALLLLLMICCQVATIAMLADKRDGERRAAEIAERTLMMNNEAAALNLESERIRNGYYKALRDGLQPGGVGE